MNRKTAVATVVALLIGAVILMGSSFNWGTGAEVIYRQYETAWEWISPNWASDSVQTRIMIIDTTATAVTITGNVSVTGALTATSFSGSSSSMQGYVGTTTSKTLQTVFFDVTTTMSYTSGGNVVIWSAPFTNVPHAMVSLKMNGTYGQLSTYVPIFTTLNVSSAIIRVWSLSTVTGAGNHVEPATGEVNFTVSAIGK